MPNTFPQQFKELRKRYRFTQSRLALELNVSASTISRWINGEYEFPEHDLEKACKEFFKLTETQTDGVVALYKDFWAQSQQKKVFKFLESQSKELPRLGEDDWNPREKSSINNVPIPMTSFIGRKQEIIEVKKLLSEHRLVTLLGPPGTGKTRLALEAVRQLIKSFKNGVWWRDLSSLQDPSLIPQVVASVLGIRDGPSQSLTQTISDSLESKHLLLALDNCEHMVKQCAIFVETLLHSCPSLHILTTSREALNIPGELVYPVSPLTLPGNIKILPCLKELKRYEAIDLFVERAHFSQINFTLTKQNARTITQICYQLDGLPLAIELAVARLKVLSVEQINTRLSDRFQLLTKGSRTAPIRHQTLRATIDWSYSLLQGAERSLFCRLSIFAGSFTLQAAEKVSSSEQIAPSHVLDILTNLVDRSLVMTEHDKEQLIRYRQLETLRQYGQEKLKLSGELNDMKHRHSAYFLEFAEHAEGKIRGPQQSVWLDRLETEHDNLRVALKWALEGKKTELSLRLTGALWWFWFVRGYSSEGRQFLAAALSMEIDDSSLVSHRAKTVHGAGVLAWYCGDYEEAEKFYKESLAIWQKLNDKWWIARSLNNLGNVRLDKGDYEQAEIYLYESLKLALEVDDKQGMALSLHTLGEVSQRQANYKQATEYHQRSLTLRQELNDNRGIADSLHELAHIAFFQENYIQALSLYKRSHTLFKEMGDKRGIAYTLCDIGNTVLAQDNYEQADEYYQNSLALQRELGDQWGIAQTLSKLGNMKLIRGESTAAGECLEEALLIWQRLNDMWWIAYSLEKSAELAVMLEQDERAIQLCGAVSAILKTTGARFTPSEQVNYDQSLSSVSARLSKKLFTKAWNEGQKMDLDELITQVSMISNPKTRFER